MLALAASTLLAFSACGGGSVDDAAAEQGEEGRRGRGDCGELNIIVNPWVGYQADAYVLGNVAQEQLGCTVNYGPQGRRPVVPGLASAMAT